ncbi:Gr23 [Eciton burchellii]|nr:Gr23 [Eciton burchellii]
MRNIQEAISPLLVLLSLCGFEVFEYPRGRLRLRLTILYVLVLWSLYIYVVIRIRLYFKEHGMNLLMITKTNIIFSITITLLNLYHNKKLRNCLRRLSLANDTLEKLGTPESYVTLRVQIRWLISGWIGSVLFLNVIDSLWFFNNIPSIDSYVVSICLPSIISHTLYINMLSDMFHMMLLRYMGSRFEQINQHIDKLTQKKQVERTRTIPSLLLVHRFTTTIETPERIMSILMHVHLELRLITHELTVMFGIHMVMQTIAFNILTVQLIKEIYNIIMKFNITSTYQTVINIFGSYIWITINVVKMIVFNLLCEEINGKANKTEVFLNRLTNDVWNIETQEYIIQFLFQLLQRPLRISGLGLYFGYKFLQQCMSYIGTVIIVTLQLRDAEDL